MKFTLAILIASTVILSAQDAVTYKHRAKIKDAAGNETVAVKIYDDKIKVEYVGGTTQKTIEAKIEKGAEKRKYRTSEGRTISGVKFGDDGFKIRDADAKLQWKIKTYETKIKISDNEEGTNPTELKTSNDGKQIKVIEKGVEIATVKFYADRGEMKLKDAKSNETILETKAIKLNSVLAVLAVKRIPINQRAILAAEILYRETSP